MLHWYNLNKGAFMKITTVLLTLAFSITASAGLTNSSYDERHLNLIVDQISVKCGSMVDLNIQSTKEEVIYVDQGITDKKFTTVLTGKQKMDQNIFDTFSIVVESSYSDMYDHTNKDWGFYSVESVNCEML
jgi:hypothetical protein